MADKFKDDCKYGVNCYQKNPAHIAKYRHPPKPQDNQQSTSRESDKKRSKSPSDENSKKVKASTSPTVLKADNVDKMNTEKNPVTLAINPSRTNEESKRITELFFSPMDEAMYQDIIESQLKEYNLLLKNPNEFIRYKFLVRMPEDFFNFWEFCKSIATDNEKPETVLECVGIKLVGPFDLLAGKFDEFQVFEPGDYLRHWRFYYDPPEFQTIIIKNNTEIHYGYWRDEPYADQCFVARNDAKQGCEMNIFGTNIFSAILYYLEHDFDATPFNRGPMQTIKKSLEEWIKTNNIDGKDSENLIKKRDKLVVCKSFHKAGLVVPYDRKTQQGYRALQETNAAIKKMLSIVDNDDDDNAYEIVLEKLQPIITAANIAFDECDFGTSLELGIDLFCHGSPKLHKILKPLLIAGYSFVKRPQFIAIMKSHLDNRRKGSKLSMFDKKMN